MDDGGAGLVIFSLKREEEMKKAMNQTIGSQTTLNKKLSASCYLGNPHLLEGGERGEDGSSDPHRVLSLGGSDDLDLHRAEKERKK